MIQKLKAYLLTAASLIMIAVPALALPAVAYAGCNNVDNQLASGANKAIGSGSDISCNGGLGNNNDEIGKIAAQIVNIFSIVVGAVAVIMIIYGGFRYITSGGDSGNVGNAKNTIIYALVGLIIVALAQFIVHFVLAKTTAAVNQ